MIKWPGVVVSESWSVALETQELYGKLDADLAQRASLMFNQLIKRHESGYIKLQNYFCQ